MDIKTKVKELPSSPGVYIMRGIGGEIIYVGKAKNLKNRVSSYFNNSAKTEKTYALVRKVVDFEYIVTLSESDALALECNLIKKNQPFFNILLKDGKQFAFLKIDFKEKYPKFSIVRKIKKDGAKYFGPYFNGASADEVLEILKSAFKLRQCKTDFSKVKKGRKPCLNHHLNKCLAPCINNCEEAYLKECKEACAFLNGKTLKVRALLEDKMKTLSQLEEFEEAMILRERLKMLNRISEKTYAISGTSFSADVFAVANSEVASVVTMLVVREGKMVGAKNFLLKNFEKHELSNFISQIYLDNGINIKKVVVPDFFGDASALMKAIFEKFDVKTNFKIATTPIEKGIFKQAAENAKEFLEKNSTNLLKKDEQNYVALKTLSELLDLSEIPTRIECFDISNTSGTNSVASMTVSENGEHKRKDYRHFKIKTVKGISDFASLQEVLTRRLGELNLKKDASFQKKPDIIVIDGGKGQLSSVLEVAKHFECAKSIKFISIAEKKEEIFVQNLTEPIVLPETSLARRLITNLRDEAHRFAISYHKKLRQKAMLNRKSKT